ncbi:MAG: adenylyltransferase/cytidyltransferase family protein [Leptospirales bacterium]|jgi:nicotinate-nucleotide adenylyltransferase
MTKPAPPPCDRLIFGGSFDPPHRGHLALLRYALEENLAPAVDLVPAAVSPFKTDAPPTPGADRRRLLEAALLDLADGADRVGETETRSGPPVDLARIQLRTIELDRPPPSYTVETCAELRRTYPGQTLGLLIGSDSLHDFDRWTRVEEILKSHPIYVFRRTGDSPEATRRMIQDLTRRIATRPATPPKFFALANPLFPCSSTDARGGVAEGGSVHCLTPRVARIITHLGLYQ